MLGLSPNSTPLNALPTPEIWRGLSGGAACGMGAGRPAIAQARAGIAPGHRATAPTSIPMERGMRRGAATDLSTRQGFPILAADGIAFGPASTRQTSVRAEWGLTERLRQRHSLAFGPALDMAAATESRWTAGQPLHQAARTVRAQAAHRGVFLVILLDPGQPRHKITDIWLRHGRHPVYVAPVPAAPGLPAPAPFQGDTHLVFMATDPANGHKDVAGNNFPTLPQGKRAGG